MAPMDEVKWFQPLRFTYFNTVARGVYPLVPYEPNRVYLMIASTFNNTSVSPDPTLAPASQLVAIPISNTTLPLIIRQKDDAVLCQSAWYIYTTGLAANVNTFTIEVLLRDWPSKEVANDGVQNELGQERIGKLALAIEQLTQKVDTYFSSPSYRQRMDQQRYPGSSGQWNSNPGWPSADNFEG